MGSSSQSFLSVDFKPSRPKFLCDAKAVLWSDILQNHQHYAEAVDHWSSYHDSLPDTNLYKYAKNVCGTIMKSGLFGRASCLANCVDIEQLQSANGAAQVGSTLYKCDCFTVLLMFTVALTTSSSAVVDTMNR